MATATINSSPISVAFRLSQGGSSIVVTCAQSVPFFVTVYEHLAGGMMPGRIVTTGQAASGGAVTIDNLAAIAYRVYVRNISDSTKITSSVVTAASPANHQADFDAGPGGGGGGGGNAGVSAVAVAAV